MSKRAPWNRCKRSIAVLLLVQLVGAGCGAGRKPPEAQRRALVEEYVEELAKSYGDPKASERTDQIARQVQAFDPSSPNEVAAFHQGPGENSSFKMISGVPEYRVGISDLLHMTTYVGPETSETRLRVQSDGTIFVPRFQLGRMEVAGLSPTEVADLLIDRFRQFAPAAYVQVEVEEYRAWIATLLGEIEFGGSGDHPLQGRTTVVEFVYDHGGPTEDANLADVRLIRNGEQVQLDVLAAMLQGRADQNPVLDVGDVVFVPSSQVGAGRVFILGEVATPGDLLFTEGLRVMDAIAQAGAFTEFADLKNGSVTRTDGGRQDVLNVDFESIIQDADLRENILLQQGDIVVVPRRPYPFLTRIGAYLNLTTLVISILTIIEVSRQ